MNELPSCRNIVFKQKGNFALRAGLTMGNMVATSDGVLHPYEDLEAYAILDDMPNRTDRMPNEGGLIAFECDSLPCITMGIYQPSSKCILLDVHFDSESFDGLDPIIPWSDVEYWYNI